MNNKLALESLVMDLKRVALGYHRNSVKMGERFYQEALKRKREIDSKSLKPYIQYILNQIEILQNTDHAGIAESALMYSTLLQNYTQTLP